MSELGSDGRQRLTQADVDRLAHPEASGDLVIRDRVATQPLDLSFRSLPRVVLVDCNLDAGLVLRGSDFTGLELHGCRVKYVDLRQARITGDLRLIDLLGHEPPDEVPEDTKDVEDSKNVEGPADAEDSKNAQDPKITIRLGEFSAEESTRSQDADVGVERPSEPSEPSEPSATADVRLTCPVNAGGLRIGGELALDGSAVSPADEDALVAAARARAPLEPDTGTTGVNWDLVLQGIGVASGLAAWVAVVGGGRLWARMEAAGVPALPTLSGVGRGWLVAEGLQTLLVPMLLGIVAGLTVYFSRRDPRLAGSPGKPSEVVTQGQSVVPDGALGLGRARPVRLLERFAVRAGSAATPLLGLLLALLAVLGILIARASWQVLVTTTLAVVAAAMLVVVPAATERSDDPSADSRHPEPGETMLHRARWRLARLRHQPAAAWVSLVAAMAAPAAVALWLFDGGAAAWAAVLAVVGVGVFGALLFMKLETAALAFLLVSAAGGILLSLAVRIELPWLGVMGAVTLLSIWLALGALADRGPRAAALVVFVSIVAWSGALGFVREIGNRTPDLPVVRVELADGAPDVGGYLLGRSSDHVYLAQDPRTDIEAGEDVDRHVVVLPEGDVERLVLGRDVTLPEVDEASSGWWRGLGDALDVSWIGLPEPGTGSDPVDPDQTVGNPPGKTPEPGPQDPTSEPPVEQPPFDPATAIGHRDRAIDGDRARLTLEAVERNGAVTYVWATVTNRSSEARTAADLLELEAGDFDTVALVDVAAEQLYRVSRRDGTCDCAEGLDRVTVPPVGSYGVWAVVVTAPDADTVDVLVPPFGVFRDVPVG